MISEELKKLIEKYNSQGKMSLSPIRLSESFIFLYCGFCDGTQTISLYYENKNPEREAPLAFV